MVNSKQCLFGTAWAAKEKNPKNWASCKLHCISTSKLSAVGTLPSLLSSLDIILRNVSFWMNCNFKMDYSYRNCIHLLSLFSKYLLLKVHKANPDSNLVVVALIPPWIVHMNIGNQDGHSKKVFCLSGKMKLDLNGISGWRRSLHKYSQNCLRVNWQILLASKKIWRF